MHAIISISKERLENITRNSESVSSYNFEVGKAEELLAQAMTLTEFGDVHQSLLVISEANLIINHIEESIKPTHKWVYDLSFRLILASDIIGFSVGALTIFFFKCRKNNVTNDARAKKQQISTEGVHQNGK